MRVTVDRARCEGHGLCEERAPSVFSLDDDDELVYSYEGADVPADQESVVTAAAAVCPVAALKIVASTSP